MMKIRENIPEELLWYLWKFRLFTAPLVLQSGEKAEVLHPGSYNNDSGPDFFNARIKIGNTVWAGNVELHVKSSDWFLHGHQNDTAYDNVILHVVYLNDKDIYRKNGEKIPVVEIKDKFDRRIAERYNDYVSSMRKIPCENDISKTDYFTLLSWLERMTIERLEEKSNQIIKTLSGQKYDFQEVFYQKLARYFGLKANNEAFETLARSLPLKILTMHGENLLQTEALLYGQAGMLANRFQDEYPRILSEEYRFLREKYGLKPMKATLWKFMRMRPANFPTVRIAQFAALIYKSSALLHKIITEEQLDKLKMLFHVTASSYWDSHYRFDVPAARKSKKSLGSLSVDILLINTVIPFVFAYGAVNNKHDLKEKAVTWLSGIKAENNRFTRIFKNAGINAENAMQSQAMIHLKTVYCDEKRCLNCAVGHYLLKRQEE